MWLSPGRRAVHQTQMQSHDEDFSVPDSPVSAYVNILRPLAEATIEEKLHCCRCRLFPHVFNTLLLLSISR